jgi:uncharacterized surface protein with fasciclin (FAS1) repeats
VKSRTSKGIKGIAAAAGVAAIAASVPFAVTAYAQPAQPAQPTPTTTAEVPYPDLQGSGCDAFKKAVPDYKALANVPVGQALRAIPDVSTFYSAISGGLNPAVNIVPVLENGPYVVFAPTNEAFAALEPGQLDALKADAAHLQDVVYYHTFLGVLGVDDVKGQRPTQQGAEIKVEGKGGDIKINGTAKVLCGAIQAANARIYLIDSVLDPSGAPEAVAPSTTPTSETSATTTTSKSPAPTPAADAPIG